MEAPGEPTPWTLSSCFGQRRTSRWHVGNLGSALDSILFHLASEFNSIHLMGALCARSQLHCSITHYSIPLLDRASANLSVHFSTVLCFGVEQNLTSCDSTRVSERDASHFKDVFLVCQPNVVAYSGVLPWVCYHVNRHLMVGQHVTHLRQTWAQP